MATIHRTTMAPTKLELLAGWLPRQPWYAGGGRPALRRAGGFRLDDPAGEVGIEFVFVTDDGGTTYHVPLTYRGAPLAGAEDGLLGTSEHGVLGTRWIHDAAHDPVAVAQLLALLHGTTEAQHQSRSDEAEPAVGGNRVSANGRLSAPSPLRVADRRPGCTSIEVVGTEDSPEEPGNRVLDIVRVLSPDAATGRAHVEAEWSRPDGGSARGPVAVLR